MIAHAVLVVRLAAAAQQPTPELITLVQQGDSASLEAAVRRRPNDARELLARWVMDAGRSPRKADSLLTLSRRVATTYASAWGDSFPASNLARFERMSLKQRSDKAAADSVRLAGNAANTRLGKRAAIRLWREAFRRSAAVPDSAGMAAALGNIGAGFYEDAQLDSAEQYLQRADRLARTVGDQRTAANALGLLGAAAMDRGDLRRADEILRSTLSHRAAIGDVRGAAADHTNLGLISTELGDTSAARSHYLEALAIARDHALDGPAATALLNLANNASEGGDYTQADTLYREALTRYRSLGYDSDVALVLHNQGLLSLRRGDYKVARERLGLALRIFTESGTTADLIRVRSDLAALDAAIGDLKSALRQLRSAELLAVESQDAGPRADVALARADLATLMNTFTLAEQQYAIAQAGYRRSGNSAGEAEARQGLAILLVERRQYARALDLLQSARRVQLSGGDRRPAALTDLLIGHALGEQGNRVSARRSFERALDTLRALDDAGGEAAALVALGDLSLDGGSPLAAEDFYRQALSRLAGRMVTSISWQAHAGLGRALWARGALASAAAEMRLAVVEVERSARSLPLAERRATFLADKWDVFADLALIERARGDAGAAFATSERMRARQMVDVLARGRMAQRDARDTVLRAREQDLRFRIGELTQRLEAEEGTVRTLRGPGLTGSSARVTREALAQAQEQYAELLLDRREESAEASGATGTSADWRAIAARLERGQVMLSYLVTDSTTLVFVVTSDTMRMVDLAIGRPQLASLVTFARGTLGRPQSGSGAAPWRTALRQLYARLIAPLEESLIGVRQLLIAPHAELHYLPFAALVAPNGTFLIERFDIGYVPSPTAWMQLATRRPASGAGVLALAPRVTELPGSREEVDAIRTIYGRDVTVLSGIAASEQAFRADARRYSVVHLATYGVLNQHNPLFSFVELGAGGTEDGRLEVHELFGVDLSARLVVLSACQTALGSGAIADVPAGDDWIGLVRAFLGAGAENVIATLWAVEDRSTARVMERLHRRLQAGYSELAALSQAQRETLRNPATAGPFYWAGFVLVGGR